MYETLAENEWLTCSVVVIGICVVGVVAAGVNKIRKRDLGDFLPIGVVFGMAAVTLAVLVPTMLAAKEIRRDKILATYNINVQEWGDIGSSKPNVWKINGKYVTCQVSNTDPFDASGPVGLVCDGQELPRK